ncbi:MAG: hypothetical protein WD969_15260 [Paracoccaceae bacterium]
MKSRLAPLLLGVCLALPAATQAAGGTLCERTDKPLIWADCGAGRVEILLLPEDAGLTPEGSLDVTGGYTATDRRESGKPKPVGLFIRRGLVVSREYVRADGVLLVDAAGAPRLLHRRRASFAGVGYDLEDPDQRTRLLAAVVEAGGSLIQSHLLIVDGVVDAHPQDGAPRFRRRILFQSKSGEFGLWDSSPRALTLAEAAEELAATFGPQMAINLDMGSYDFCREGTKSCGLLSYAETGKLSNILRFSRD